VNSISSPKPLDKRPYMDRVYASRMDTESKWLWAYLVDRMWPFENARRFHQGEVMPAFLSVNRMHTDTGLHRETVDSRLMWLTEAGVVLPFLTTSGEREVKRFVAILLMPPGQKWNWDTKKCSLMNDAKSLEIARFELALILKDTGSET
jgi:hypothetical protein